MIPALAPFSGPLLSDDEIADRLARVIGTDDVDLDNEDVLVENLIAAGIGPWMVSDRPDWDAIRAKVARIQSEATGETNTGIAAVLALACVGLVLSVAPALGAEETTPAIVHLVRGLTVIAIIAMVGVLAVLLGGAVNERIDAGGPVENPDSEREERDRLEQIARTAFRPD